MRGLALFALAASLCPMVASAADVSLDDMRKAVDKYKDVKVALADGYITPDNHCVSAANSGLPPELGAMGIHYINPKLLEITGTVEEIFEREGKPAARVRLMCRVGDRQILAGTAIQPFEPIRKS